MHILVIEDERSLCETIVRSLRRLAYSVDFCYDGNNAIELLCVERYDLVLLDLNLPGADGMTVLRTLRQTDRDTKVLILSARSFFRSAEICTRIELLKLSTLLSHTWSISSSWLTGRPWFSSRYSSIPISFRVRVNACSSAVAVRAFVSKATLPQVRITSLCVNCRRVRLRILASSSSR